MNIHQRKDAFLKLGSKLGEIPNNALHKAILINPWFTSDNIDFAFGSIVSMLQESSINTFLARYEEKMKPEKEGKNIAVVMAGNIPLVGFHDFLCVLFTGHRFTGKLSSDDPELLKLVAEELISIEPAFKDMISFTSERLSDFDAVIATGSNNTARYFESYFGKYPHIIRKNRNGLAVLTGSESQETLKRLGEDIFRYFGMGCRNVSKVFIPEGYNWQQFFDAIQAYESILDHNKYNNNYTYNKTIMVLNGEQYYDSGFLLLKEDPVLSSPLSVLHYRYISDHDKEIQCIVSESTDLTDVIQPGQSQHPKLWDYADNIDTMEFLLTLG